MSWHLWLRYWGLVGGNIGAMPLEAAITLAAGVLLIRPLRRAGRTLRARVLAPMHDRLDGIEARAAAAHQIAADTHRHLTGREHPAAPERRN